MDLHKQADNLLRKCRDYLDDPSSSTAKTIMSKFQKLEDQLQVKANPKSVEATATDIINTLDRLDGSVMSYHHSDWLKNRVEDIRDILRRM